MGIFVISIFLIPVSAEAAGKETKIHFISLNNATDAILLESNGHYGLVDFGEDWEYPDGTDSRYPLRDGVTKGIGYEQQVIHYLNSQGVEKLDFCIATHSHSDHIGSGDEILDGFPTDRLYINRYDDSYIIKGNEAHLWDNQYIYDDIIDAANRNGTEIITDLDLDENAEYRSFTLGDMTLDLLNLERRRDENGQIMPVVDENENCIVIKVTAFGRTALLTADIVPTEGDTGKLANQLIAELGDLPQCQQENNAEPELEETYTKDTYRVGSGTVFDLLENRVVKDSGEINGIDESQINTGKTIRIDLMKMAHHSIDYNNTTYFLTSLNPKAVVITGYKTSFSQRQRDCLPNTDVYATTTNSAAVIAEFKETGIETYYAKIPAEWMKLGDSWYYFDENGRTFTDQSVHEIDGRLYCYDKKGAVETRNRWVKMEGKWKYWLETGEFLKNSWLNLNNVTYYLDEDGNAVIGWKQIDNKGYYFNESGAMASESWIGDDYVDASGVWRLEILKEKWISSGEKWWYRHSDGSYTTSDWEWINGKWYYFDASGWMLTGWQKIGSDWYYLYDDGTMAFDVWIGNYYLKADGRMAVSEWVQDGKYYVDENGLWVI